MIYSGGYFLTRSVDRPPYVSSDLLPPRLLSISNCICDFIPYMWAIEWVTIKPEDRCAEGAKFGLSPHQLGEVVSWATTGLASGVIGWPGVFFSVEQARAFAGQFLEGQSGIHLLGIGLHAKLVDGFLTEEKPKDSEGPAGIYEAIEGRTDLETNGIELGWEILCYGGGDFHSWLCNSLETEIFEKFGIKPIESGFISSVDQAEKVANYCGSDEVGAEPGFWAPWLIVEYPVRAELED